MVEGVWRVAVPVPLRRCFYYRIPPGSGQVTRGARVLVPFGNRKLTGYLIDPVENDGFGAGSKPDSDSFKLKSILDVLDEEPVFDEPLLNFLIEASVYYQHPIGEVLRTALPAGTDFKQRNGELFAPRLAVRHHEVVRLVAQEELDLETIKRRAPVRAAVLERIIKRRELPVAELRSLTPRARELVRRLTADGIVEVAMRERPIDPFFSNTVPNDEHPELTDEQQIAVSEIAARLERPGYEGFLLHGITGSGKTEVYFRIIAHLLARDRGALVLVPEIALTPQLVERYRARFGNGLVVLHSGLSDRDRYEQWRLLKAGRIRVAIGTRSAVFAPVDRLGAIIVDEEHDGSFKQERGFNYHARDLALLRSARLGIVAILGSATPSLETHYNAIAGKLRRLELKKRATSQPLPSGEVVDLRRHHSGPGSQAVIAAPLFRAIEETLERKEQTILFLNRRGFAPGLTCSDCGVSVRCRSCAVAMTLHLRPPRLICHYCGAKRAVPKSCPECARPSLDAHGIGTQKVEQILCELFPQAAVARLDRDVATGAKIERVLTRLRRGEIDILVGTQMVTKGHDFPKVTLVGVLLADVGLQMPDFRAAERTFQLLTQVAGRAGRTSLGGRAVIQTFSPHHPAVSSASQHDFQSFAQAELSARQELGYPPFGRMVALRLSSVDENRVESAARNLLSSLRAAWQSCGSPPVAFLGPAPAPLSFVQNRYRWHILLRARRHDIIRSVLEPVLVEIEAPPTGVRIGLDVDPISML